MTQLCTAIMLACCPLMRPMFDKLVGKLSAKLTTKTTRNEPGAIVRMTRIEVSPASSRPNVQNGGFNDRFQEAEGPTFEVERCMSEIDTGACCWCSTA